MMRSDHDVRILKVTLLGVGDELSLGFAKDGARAYVCVEGGVDVPIVLGRRDCRGSEGGYRDRARVGGAVGTGGGLGVRVGVGMGISDATPKQGLQLEFGIHSSQCISEL